MKPWGRYWVQIALILLPACRVVDWGKRRFDQGEPRTNAKADVRAQVRSSRIYNDQFETVGLFDALYLSSEVRTAWVDVMLKDGDRYIKPRTVKSADLGAEYNNFLYGILSKHKEVYKLSFDSVATEGRSVRQDKSELELVLATVDRSTTLTWRLV